MSVHKQINESIAEHLQSVFQKQKSAYLADPYPSVAVRKERLKKLKKLILDNEQAICEAISADFGCRSPLETKTVEILPTILGIKDALRQVSKWMRSEHKIAPLLFQPVSAKVQPQPLGVIGVIVPFNYPVMLSVGPLISAFSAGNSAMVKMSELTPEFGALFAKLIAEEFDENVVTVFNGELEVAQAFASIPFDHLLFTGSTTVGKHIMRAASENLTPVTLELGGKSPAVIDRSIPIREAASRLVYPKNVNAGQTCVAPDYVLCPNERIEEFTQFYLSEANRQYGPAKDNAEFSSVINERQRQRLIAYVEEARSKGAVVTVGGESDDLKDYGQKIPPVVLSQVPEGCRILEEEIFGPLLVVVGYEHLEETIQYINARPRPLALYVFGYERQLRKLFAQKTHSGALLFNEGLIHVAMENLPFGGVGSSGMGHYHGKYGFQTFSKLKPIVSKQRLSSLKLIYPPYKTWLLSLMFKVFGR